MRDGPVTRVGDEGARAGPRRVEDDGEEGAEGARAPLPEGAEAAVEGVDVHEVFEDFVGRVDEYPHSFWRAVEDAVIPTPPLMDWNEWQRWRSQRGGLPREDRGRKEQQFEADLRVAAMTKFYGKN